MKLAIELSEAQEQRLSAISRRLNVPVESLAKAAIRELTDGASDDFQEVADLLLSKNRELYERLR